MSNTVTDKLSRKKIQQLLAAVGSKPAEDTTQIEAAEYDWHQPHCFTRAQLNKLDDFTKKIAKAIARRFATLCHGEFNVTIASTTQHFANELVDQALESKQNNYYLPFGTDQAHPCGLVSIPLQTTFIWVTQLLGDTESEEDSRRDLSQLEESLLLDIASAIVDAISDSHGNCDFKPAKNIVRRLFPLELRGTEEFCKITFNVKKSDSDNTEAYILIFCESLESVAGKATQDAGEFSAADISKAILERLKKMPVFVTAQLASAMLTLEEIMDFQVGDILLLDKAVDEPVELIVEGRELLRGRPAKSGGKYAVVITELSCDTEQNINPITGT